MTDNFDLFKAQCTQAVSETCEDQTIPLSPAGMQLLMSSLVTNANFFINFMMTYNADALTWNQKQAMNSVRCAAQNGGENMWYFLASAYYLIVQFANQQLKNKIQNQWDKYYPYLCTCNEERIAFEGILKGSDESFGSQAAFSSCSESAQKEALSLEQINVAKKIFTEIQSSDADKNYYGWSNSTRIRDSNVTFNAEQALNFTKKVFEEYGWKYTEVDVIKFNEAFDNYKDSAGVAPMIDLQPVLVKVIAYQGDKHQDDYYDK